MSETMRQALKEIKAQADRLDAILKQRGSDLPDLAQAQGLVQLDKLRAGLGRLALKLEAAKPDDRSK